jgi:hypothetical protein
LYPSWPKRLRHWLEQEGSEDCHARVLWAAGTALGRSSNPRRSEGYCTDDNARAFILTLLLHETTSLVTQQLASIYLAFLWHAFDQETCRFRNLCALLFQRGLAAVENFRSPRAWAFALLAIQEYLRAFSGDRGANRLREVLTARLVELFRTNSSDDWVWFEPVAAYDNAKLSQAMILSGYWTSRGDVVEIGLRSLRWLVERQKARRSFRANRQ